MNVYTHRLRQTHPEPYIAQIAQGSVLRIIRERFKNASLGNDLKQKDEVKANKYYLIL